MSTQFSGEPAVTENALPAAVNIASSTNATPVVITTSTPHGLSTGDYFVCAGADEPHIDDVLLMAGTVTGTTVVALKAPLASNTVGTLAGGAAGTLQPLGFGASYAIPSDLTDEMTAASVNVAFEALGDRTAYLMYRSQTGPIAPSYDLPAVDVTVTGVYPVYFVPPLGGSTITVRFKDTAPLPPTGLIAKLVYLTGTFGAKFRSESAGSDLGEITPPGWVTLRFNGTSWDPIDWSNGTI